MRFFTKNDLSFSHFPTWMLVIGYPLFWLEMYFHRSNHGVTTPLAWLLFAGLFLYLLGLKIKKKSGLQFTLASLKQLRGSERIFVWAGTGLCLIILLVSAYASYFPPHLMQESDVLSYHYTLPRQNLIANSFSHLPWSVFDVFLYPVQFALSPFWFSTSLPNKVPQFLFLIGILLIAVRLTDHFSQQNILKSIVAVFAVLGSHHVGIQSGTAMLDLVLAYLFLAALDSFLRGNLFLASIESTFYFWSKAFIPLQTLALVLAIAGCVWALKHFRFKFFLSFAKENETWTQSFKERFKKVIPGFLILSLLVGAPFWVKSMAVSGTPLYPFFVRQTPPPFWKERAPEEWGRFLAATDMLLSMQNAYGLERTPVNFFKHLWLVAVPEKGVNNRFDYPLGLIYLLCAGPFFWLFFKGLFKKELALIPLFVLLFWLSWWFGSQQTRFLYVPLLLMYFLVFAEVKISRVLMFAILCSLALTCLSVIRANKMDWGQDRLAVLRAPDRDMMEKNQVYLTAERKDVVAVEHNDVGYAQFPVFIAVENLPYVIKVQGR